MAQVKKDLIKILEELKEKDFKGFKWNLENHRSPKYPQVIPPCDLENADRMDTVDLMVRCYDTDSVQVAMDVLEEIRMNNLAERLSKLSSKGNHVDQREPKSIPQETPRNNLADKLSNTNSEGELHSGGGDGGQGNTVGQREPKSIRQATPRVQPDEVRWMRRDLMKDSCELTIDPNTVNGWLKLSDNNRKVTHVEGEFQSYPDHSDRFDNWTQLLCTTGLTGCCYWEVEWRGVVLVSVSYGGIKRKGDSGNCRFGYNDQSWCLICSDKGFYVQHNNTETHITSSSSFLSSGTVAVYVDCPAGSLSFFRVSSDTLILLHTFSTTFTEPLYPGFGLWSDSSVSLCSL